MFFHLARFLDIQQSCFGKLLVDIDWNSYHVRLINHKIVSLLSYGLVCVV